MIKQLYRKSKKEGLTIIEFKEAERLLGIEMNSLYDFDKAMNRDKKEGLGKWL